MKRKLSLILALSMMLSVVPMSTFAATDNSVNKIVTVKDDAELTTNAPTLKIENEDGDLGTQETFVLHLENAEWLEDDILTTGDDLETIVQTAVYASVANATEVIVDRKSDSKLEVAVKGTFVDTDVFEIPLYVEMDGAGAATVAVSSKSGTVTEQEIKFAVGASGSTTVMIEDTTDFSNDVTMETIEIEENAIGAIDLDDDEDGYIKFKLTNEFEFTDLATAEISAEIFENKTYTIQDLLDAKIADINSDKDELKIFIKGATSTETAIKIVDADVRATIEMSGLGVKAGSKADEGTVELTVSSDLSEIETTTLEVGEFAEYKVTVEADGDAEEIFGGRYEVTVDYDAETTSTTDADHELQTLIIEEETVGSWDDNKTITVAFPSWVKIVDVDKAGDDGDAITEESIDENEYEFEMDSTKVNGKKKVELTFYVSVEAGQTGDIEAKVSGRALDAEYEVVLGKAVAPIKVESEVTKLKAGVRNQEIGKITITETDEEAIKENADIVIELDKDIEWDEEPTITVVKGDIEIDEDDVEIDDNILTIHVDEESSEASVIEITDGIVKIDRSISEGAIVVEVKGDALIQNGYDEDLVDGSDDDVKKSDQLEEYARFSNDYYTKVEVANVITPADDNVQSAEEVNFVIGKAEYKVGEETKTADVAPYIKDGRTMLSLRFAAEAIGVSSNDIMWDGATRTVTIIKGDRIAQVQIGSNKLMVNGTAITMDTVAEIKNARTMLPVSFIARALGSEVTWDGATRTVTIK